MSSCFRCLGATRGDQVDADVVTVDGRTVWILTSSLDDTVTQLFRDWFGISCVVSSVITVTLHRIR